MAFDFRPRLLMYESFMFISVQLIALLTGLGLILTQQAPPRQGPVTNIPELASGSWQILLAFAIAVVLIFILLRFIKVPAVWGGFFAFIIFIGAQTVFGSFLPFFFGSTLFSLILSVVLAAAIVIARWVKPNLATHNLAIFLGVAGVSAVLGLTLVPIVIIFLLIILSVYDFIAVFKTRHMVTMFQDLLKRGMPLAIVVPESSSEFTAHIGEVSRRKLKESEGKHRHEDKKVLMLGTGDLAFPALFAVSALAEHFTTAGYLPAIAIIIGAVIGIVFNHYLLFVKKYRFIPALPFIAAFSIIGYVIAILPDLII